MKEVRSLIQGWRSIPNDQSCVLATVVQTQGSTYRKTGARMLLSAEAWIAGSISGGCLEGDVLQTSWERTAEGPALVTYDSSADDDILWGFGLGCNGVVKVLLERILPKADGENLTIGFLSDRIEKRTHGVLATVIQEGPLLGSHAFLDADRFGWQGLGWQGFADVAMQPIEEVARRKFTEPGCSREVIGGIEILFESIAPPTQLLVCGAGHDSIPLVQIAETLGWHVTVTDPRSGYLRSDRFTSADRLLCMDPKSLDQEYEVGPADAIVIMSHHYENDRAYLAFALSSRAGYIGLLGPSRRAQRLFSDLESSGVASVEDARRRVYSPIGLDLGAEGPAQIALSIVAEIQAAGNHRDPHFLRGRTEPIHPPSPLESGRVAANVQSVPCKISRL